MHDAQGMQDTYTTPSDMAQAQGRASPWPAHARPWARAGLAAAWYVVFILYVSYTFYLFCIIVYSCRMF